MKQQHNGRGHNSWASLGLGAIGLYLTIQQSWALWQVARKDVAQTLREHVNEAPRGLTFSETRETDLYVKKHTIENGIERIVYTPKERRYDTPIVMQHGMWHGAWCWQLWQELLAGQGWETHAHSLPGHANSTPQRPIRLCTLDYYLAFLNDEIERMVRPPVLMGHSMGGALTQWYLKHISDRLPAAVLVAPWVSHAALQDGLPRFLRLDPWGCVLMLLDWSATPLVRNPQRAAKALTSKRAVYTPTELYEQLTPESALIFYQHNPPFWAPASSVSAPMLWLAGEHDAVIGEAAERRSAAHYDADYVMVEKAGHNLMMEHNYRETAVKIHRWLVEQGID